MAAILSVPKSCRGRLAAVTVLAAVALTSCSTDTPSATTTPPPSAAGTVTTQVPAATTTEKAPLTAQAAAQSMKASIPQVLQVVTYKPLLLEPTAAVALVDSRQPACNLSDPDIDCGATLEQYPDEAAASARMQQIQRANDPTVPDHLTGRSDTSVASQNLVLRISGGLPADAIAQYRQAFSHVVEP